MPTKEQWDERQARSLDFDARLERFERFCPPPSCPCGYILGECPDCDMEEEEMATVTTCPTCQHKSPWQRQRCPVCHGRGLIAVPEPLPTPRKQHADDPDPWDWWVDEGQGDA